VSRLRIDTTPALRLGEGEANTGNTSYVFDIGNYYP